MQDPAAPLGADRLPVELLARVAEFLPCGDGWGAFRLACRAFRAASADAARELAVNNDLEAACALAEIFRRARLAVELRPRNYRWRHQLIFSAEFRRLIARGRASLLRISHFDLDGVTIDDLRAVPIVHLCDCSGRPLSGGDGAPPRRLLHLHLKHCDAGLAQVLAPPSCAVFDKRGARLGGPRGPDPGTLAALAKASRLVLEYSVRDLTLFRNVEDLDLSRTTVEDVSALGGVRRLNLRNTRVIDVGALGGVEELDLSFTRVSDVASLGRVRKLNLKCTLVQNVGALGGVKWLDLSNTMVTDVSALGGAEWLDLSVSCVVDVSALGRVKVLFLRGTDVEDVGALGGVEELYLGGCYLLRDVSALGRVRRLELRGTSVSDVSMLGGLQFLDLRDCRLVRDISALGRLSRLIFKQQAFDGDVSMLGGLDRLSLAVGPQICGLGGLIGVRKLSLVFYGAKADRVIDISELAGFRGSIKICQTDRNITLTGLSAVAGASKIKLKWFDNENVEGLEGARSVTLEKFSHLTDLSSLSRADEVCIMSCARVTSVDKLRAVKRLTFYDCPGITDVSALAEAESLELNSCTEVTDVSGLGGVGRLTVSHCGDRIAGQAWALRGRGLAGPRVDARP